MYELLPPEIIVHVYSYLGKKDVLNGNLVCVLWRNALETRRIWERRFYTDFKIKRTESITDPRLNPKNALVRPVLHLPLENFFQLSALCSWRARYCQQIHIMNNWKQGNYFANTVALITHHVREDAPMLNEVIPKPLYCDGTCFILQLISNIKVWRIFETGVIAEQGDVMGLEEGLVVLHVFLIDKRLFIIQPNFLSIFERKNFRFNIVKRIPMPNTQNDPHAFRLVDYVDYDVNGPYFSLAIQNSNGCKALYSCEFNIDNAMELLRKNNAIERAANIILKFYGEKLYIITEGNPPYSLISYDMKTKEYTLLYWSIVLPTLSRFSTKYVIQLFRSEHYSKIQLIEISTGFLAHTIDMSAANNLAISDCPPFILVQRDKCYGRLLNTENMTLMRRFPLMGTIGSDSAYLIGSSTLLHTHEHRNITRLVVRDANDSFKICTYPADSSWVYFVTDPFMTKLVGITREERSGRPDNNPQFYKIEILYFW